MSVNLSAKGGKLWTTSWILIVVVGSLLLFASSVSAWLAYSGADFPIAGEPVAEVAGNAEVEAALRGARGTAAAYAASFAVLMISIAAGPYRQGTKWSWWTLLGAYIVLVFITSMRMPALGIAAGVGAAAIPGGLVLLALLLDVGRLRSSSEP